MTSAVEDVLVEIGADEAPTVLVLNKADIVEPERLEQLARRHPEAVIVSGVTGEGLDRLGRRIEDEFARTLHPVELLLPYDEGARLAELHHLAGDLEREDKPEGVLVSARLPAGLIGRFDRFVVSGRAG
jgi:GTP-binding protein HflX